MCTYFKTKKKMQLKRRMGVNDFPTERLLSDYQATSLVSCGNLILSPTVAQSL